MSALTNIFQPENVPALTAILRAYGLITLLVTGALYIVYRVLKPLFLDPLVLRRIPGPLQAMFSSLDISIASLKGQRAHRLAELHGQFGPIVRIGPKEVSIADPKHYRTIYGNPRTSAKDPGFYTAATFIGHDNIFSMTNKAQHSARRKLGATPYSLQSIKTLEPLVKEKANTLVNRLVSDASASSSGEANVLELCGLLSFEVICKAGLGKDLLGSDDDDSKTLLKAMDGTAMTMIFNQSFPNLYKSSFATRLPGPLGMAYTCRNYWAKKTGEMLDHFLSISEKTDNYLLTPYVNGIDGFLGRRLNNQEILEMMGIMFAVSGTTSTTMTYLLYSLSLPEHHHMQQRLRDELLQVQNIDDVSSLKDLPYLNATIKETFRLYPTIISTLPRILDEPITVDSYVLQPGTIVGMQNLVHHGHTSVFSDPERFLQERWLSSNEEMEAALTPFGIGRRSCIGQNLAWTELYVGVSQIVKRTQFSLGGDMTKDDMVMDDRFNIAPKGKRLMLKVIDLQARR